MKFHDCLKTWGCVAFAASALAPCALDAKTVAWYHFDEVAPGTPVVSSDIFYNAVDPSKYPGKPYSMGVYGTDDYLALGSDPDFMPRTTNTASETVHVFDPVGRTATPLDRALYLRYADDTTANRPARYSGCVKVDADSSLSLSTFTVEFFVRPERLTSDTRNGWTFVSKEAVANTAFTYSVCAYDNGYPYVNIQKSDGTYITQYDSGNGFAGSRSILDGKWHHIALTVSGNSAKLYVDYALAKSVTLSSSLYYVDNGPLYIGACKTVYKPGGSIDEVRISDEALTPDSFLRKVYPDAVFHVGFDGSCSEGVLDRLDDNFAYPAFTNDQPNTYLVNGVGRTLKKDNGGALRIDGGCVKFPHDSSLDMQEMTVECFLKCHASSNYAGILRVSPANADWSTTGVVWGVSYTTDQGLRMRIDTGTEPNYTFNQPKSFGFSFLDGEWHHLGITFEKNGNNTKVKVYDNYVQVGSDWNVNGKLDFSHGSCLGIGTCSYTLTPLTPKRALHGCIDEVRISKGVLPVEYFMRGAPRPGLAIFVR